MFIDRGPEEPVKKKRRKNLDTDQENENEKPVAIEMLQKVRKKHIPNLRLKPAGDIASLITAEEERIPLMLTDIQHLLLHSLFGNINLSQPPRWYVLDKGNHISHTTCIILEGLSIHHWEKYQQQMINLNKIFKHKIEILTPSVYNASLVKELALVPLSENDKEAIIQKYGSMNLALEARKDLMVMMRAVFPIEDGNSENFDYSNEDAYPRTQLILSAWQLVEDNYPLPLKGKLQNAYADYVLTKEEYKPVTAKSPMFGLDCEMCLTNAGSELTRVTIVNEKHESIYETLVKPYNDITDYLTKYSGITASLLTNVDKRLEDVQKEIRDLLPPDAILVGHSLNTDLHALKMMHPYVIDTSVVFNITGERCRKPKLKVLAREFLNEIIQSGKEGHCSKEDAIATLKVVQLKLKKDLEFGDAVHTNRKQYKENMIKVKQKEEYALSIFNHIIEQKKTSIVVGCDNITGDYHTYLTQAKESLNSQLKKNKVKKVKLCTVDGIEEVISKLTESVSEYNLAMGHLKLETNVDNELHQMLDIDAWIQRVWDSLKLSGLFVIVFGGTADTNGIAMMRVKDLT
ncbi:PREDICTED: putative RNA exonuclease NEF-sp isoform X2 [Papilio polytes]|uniref:putative RNA exonuclease NEF-sp isoform X2 n=1 Tax=Papilio polytes TaxID=76194 RepID=UPI000675E0D6|nr:PREDICTED: putative RNA exonuclease NEF-sp isoform X2 [Papilio polytes]